MHSHKQKQKTKENWNLSDKTEKFMIKNCETKQKIVE